MKTIYKILFFIGLLSTVGGLKNGVIFFGGILISVIFGILAFGGKSKNNHNSLVKKPQPNDFSTSKGKNTPSQAEVVKDNEENYSQTNTQDNQTKDEVKSHIEPPIPSQPTKPQKTQLEKLHAKLDLLSSSFKNDLISKQQYEEKTAEIKEQIIFEKEKLKKIENETKEKQLNAFIESQISDKILQLDQLLSEELISVEEYKMKKSWLILDAKKDYEDQVELINPNHFTIAQNPSSKLFGYKNIEKKLVIDYLFEDAFPFNDGLAAVIVNGKRGYIDYKGEFVINPIYDKEGTFFNDGIATVALNGEIFRINTKGERV